MVRPEFGPLEPGPTALIRIRALVAVKGAFGVAPRRATPALDCSSRPKVAAAVGRPRRCVAELADQQFGVRRSTEQVWPTGEQELADFKESHQGPYA